MRIERSIDIAAPPEKVWAVISDVERWSEWTASITSIERLDAGEFGIGSSARVKQPKLPVNIWRVTEYRPGVYFAWEVAGPGYRTVGGHGVEAAATGSRATLTLEQTGVLGSIFALWFKKLSRDYVEMELQGLKRRSESPGDTAASS